MNSNIEELITALYDLIQDAKALPLGADKCIVERDRVLDMLDEISAQMPGEIKQARTIVLSREEIVSQARREAESVLRNARAQADALVEQQNIYLESKRRCEEMVAKTQAQMEELKRVSSAYVDSSLRDAEETINKALAEVRNTRGRFAALTSKEPAAASAPAGSSFDQDLD
jgi:F0F1-type ATP synthase membrane subunit b/b'